MKHHNENLVHNNFKKTCKSEIHPIKTAKPGAVDQEGNSEVHRSLEDLPTRRVELPLQRYQPHPHHHPTNAEFRIDTLGKPNDAWLKEGLERGA